MPHMQDEAAAKVEAVLLAEGSLVTTPGSAKTPKHFQAGEVGVRLNEPLEASCPQRATPRQISSEHMPRSQEHNLQPSI
jgi:hypothetical protein